MTIHEKTRNEPEKAVHTNIKASGRERFLVKK
jgi:hypothetical protein